MMIGSETPSSPIGIGPQSEQVSPPSSNMEKRKHVSTGDSPPPSPPLTEKRIRVEHSPESEEQNLGIVESAPPPPGEHKRDKGAEIEDPIESSPGEQERDKGAEIEHPNESSLPPEEEEMIMGYPRSRFLMELNHDVPDWVFERFKEEVVRKQPFWDAIGDKRWHHFRIIDEGYCPEDDDEPCTATNSSVVAINQENQGCQEKVSPDACITSILNFKEKHEFYHELRGFAEKAVSFFNDKNAQNLCFDDIESVASCHSSGNHYLLTIKAVDTVDVNSVTLLRGKVRRGIVEAEVDDCELLTLAAY